MTRDDDPEVFLEIVERAAEAEDWDNTMWAVHLGPLLIGGVQVIHWALPREEVKQHARVKEVIFQKFGILALYYRQQF